MFGYELFRQNQDITSNFNLINNERQKIDLEGLKFSF